MSAPRPWGFWTKSKLDMLSSYLNAFTRACGKAQHTIYLDLFAGQTDNELRDTGGKIDGSLVRALSTSPPFTFVRGFELSAGRAATLQAACQSRFPSRDVVIYPGDVHSSISRALNDLTRFRWAPTFAFVDPDGIEAGWELLQQLAKFRAGENKTELFILVFSSAVGRVVHQNLPPEKLGPAQQSVTRMFGSTDWRLIIDARRRDLLTPEEARDELTNLMRWRLQTVLGYRYTHTCRVTNVGGSALYDLVFATDHPTGNKIMKWVYKQAVDAFPEMRRQANAARRDRRESETGNQGLFTFSELAETGPIDLPEETYIHEPPVPPYGYR